MKNLKVPRKLKKIVKKHKGDLTCADCIANRSMCFVCWSIEENPEIFTETPEQVEQMNKAADYIRKHNLTPNMDGIDY